MKRFLLLILALTAICWVACVELIEPDLSELQIRSLHPADSLYTNKEILTFRWEASDQIQNYRFQLSRQEGGTPFLWIDTVVQSTSLRLELLEGSYQWTLTAENDRSATIPSQQHFFIDKHPPLIPKAVFPLSGDTLSQDEKWELRWRSGDQISWPEVMPVTDSLYLYRWQNAWPFLVKSVRIDEVQPKRLDISFLSDQETAEYRWEVKSFDRLGNSSCSRLFQFYLP